MRAYRPLLLASLLALLLGSAHAVTVAPPTQYTFQPSDHDLGDLDHTEYYTWGIHWSVPANQRIVGATLSISNITNYDTNANILYLHLLDNPAVGIRTWTDNQGGGDNFAGQGPLIGTFTDTNGVNATNNLVFNFNDSLLSSLRSFIANNGVFGFGLDPDCHFYNDGISLEIRTQSIAAPEPATLALGAIGLVSLGLARRRRARR